MALRRLASASASAQQLSQPAATLSQPVTGFHVTLVHSIALFVATGITLSSR